MSDLTIGIPTYNRKNELIRLLDSISQFSNNDLSIIVADNCSDYDIAEVIRDFPRLSINLVRRPYNIGPVANILRLFEEAKSEWLMIVGDDDEIACTFKESIDVINNADAFTYAIKFSSELYLSDDKKFIKCDEFIEFLAGSDERFSSTALISTWAFRLKNILPYLRFGYMYSGTHIPHVIIVLACLSTVGKEIQISSKVPVRFNNPPINNRWNIALTYSSLIINLLTCHFFMHEKNFQSIIKSISGTGFRQIFGFNLRVVDNFEPWKYRQILKIVNITFKHKLAYITARIVYRMRNFKLIQIYFNKYVVSNNYERM